MITGTKQEPWEAYVETVQGASHKRTGLPNQDASKKTSDGTVLAVADGHGNAKSFRSKLGAEFAVEVAEKTLCEFADAFARQDNLAIVEQAMESELPRTIVRRWQDRVDEHRTNNPFTAVELEALNPNDRRTVEETPTVAFGTTLLAVLRTDGFIAYLQLGDGDILVVSDKGEVSRPIPVDGGLIGNETTSMCSLGSTGRQHRPGAGSTGAWNEFRTRLLPIAATQPALILISTDGYRNSFRSDADFLQVGPDLLEMMRSNGLEYLKSNLENWLAEASAAGSGDDVTVGLLCRMDVTGNKLQNVSSSLQDSSESHRPSWWRRLLGRTNG